MDHAGTRAKPEIRPNEIREMKGCTGEKGKKGKDEMHRELRTAPGNRKGGGGKDGNGKMGKLGSSHKRGGSPHNARPMRMREHRTEENDDGGKKSGKKEKGKILGDQTKSSPEPHFLSCRSRSFTHLVFFPWCSLSACLACFFVCFYPRSIFVSRFFPCI